MIKSFLKYSRILSNPVNKTCYLQHISSFEYASFKDKLEKRQKDMGEQEFKKEIEFLVNKPSFTLADYKQRIIDGLARMKKGLRAKLASGNEATEANLVTQRKILNSMFDDELVDDTKIKGEKKKDIAIVSQTSLQEVNIMMKNYEQLKSMHTWLKEIKERGEPLPQTQEELFYRFRRDKPLKKSYIKFKMSKPRFSKRQIRQRLKWGPRKKI